MQTKTETLRTEFTHKINGEPRNSAVQSVLRHFRYSHLPSPLREVSAACSDLAFKMADSLPESADLTIGLRELLAAKDNFVRSLVP